MKFLFVIGSEVLIIFKSIKFIKVNQKKGGGMEYRVMLKVKKLYPKGIPVGSEVVLALQCSQNVMHDAMSRRDSCQWCEAVIT